MQGSCHCVMEALAGFILGGEGEGVGEKLMQNKKGFGRLN